MRTRTLLFDEAAEAASLEHSIDGLPSFLEMMPLSKIGGSGRSER